MHLVKIWIAEELVSVVVETLYYDIYWLSFYKEFLTKFYREKEYKVLDERYVRSHTSSALTTIQRESLSKLEEG